MRSQRYLVIFVKAPVLGQVKTRLGAAIGEAEAQAFYRRETARLLHRLDDRRWHLVLLVSPDQARSAAFWPQRLPRITQGRGDIGDRMARAFHVLPPGPVVIAGSDIPAIERPMIANAFRALGTADAVFGPAADGGFWLVGLKARARHLPLFRGVRWSSPHALADTRANLASRSVALIETLRDVDTKADYDAWRFSCSRSRGISSTKLHGAVR
jgi:rSAM/selenodomain-associated transferase 1